MAEMKDNALKNFIEETYKTSSPIPYIITVKVVLFVLIYIFELLNFTGVISENLYTITYEKLSLPSSLTTFLTQPWSIVTHPFVYSGIFNLIFDCLWLYWMGNIFLNLLSNRQFLTVFVGGLVLGSFIYLGIDNLPFFTSNVSYWNTTSFGLAALVSCLYFLNPNLEVRLFLLGNVKLRTIATIYLVLEITFIVFTNQVAAISYFFAIPFGLLFMSQLQKGNDWSKIFSRNKRPRHLKVIKSEIKNAKPSINPSSDLPNQEEIDEILDKISLNGYESLTSYEKEVLFKASKLEN